MKGVAITVLSVSFVHAHQYAISTYAGVPPQPNASSGYFGLGLAVDAAENVYFPPTSLVAPAFSSWTRGVVSRIAGNSQPGFSGDGGPAASALLNRPNGLAVDGAGNLFVADSDNNRIRKIAPDGTITTVAGSGERGYAQDGQPALSASLAGTSVVAADSAGNVFIADNYLQQPVGGYHSRILKLSPDGASPP